MLCKNILYSSVSFIVRNNVAHKTSSYIIYADGTFKQWFKNISSISVTYEAGYLWYGYGTSIQRTSLVSQNIDNVSVGINSSNDWGAYEIFDQSLSVYVYSHIRHISTLTQHVMIEGHI